MQQLKQASQFWVALCAAVFLSACGGGGGDSGTPTPLPNLSQDSVPTGARIDVSARNYFPLKLGDQWVYTKTFTGNANGAPVTRTVTSAANAAGWQTVSDLENGATETQQLRVTTAGFETLDPMGAAGIWPGVAASLPSFIDYPTPFYAVDGVRSVVRQGDMQADIDGDGKNDSFRLEFTQVFVGFESLPVLGKAVEVAHFRTVIAFTIRGSSTGKQVVVTATYNNYLADGLGEVRQDSYVNSSDGSVPEYPYSMVLKSAVINGKPFG
jgi:hypothetical protein